MRTDAYTRHEEFLGELAVTLDQLKITVDQVPAPQCEVREGYLVVTWNFGKGKDMGTNFKPGEWEVMG